MNSSPISPLRIWLVPSGPRALRDLGLVPPAICWHQRWFSAVRNAGHTLPNGLRTFSSIPYQNLGITSLVSHPRIRSDPLHDMKILIINEETIQKLSKVVAVIVCLNGFRESPSDGAPMVLPGGLPLLTTTPPPQGTT